ncbi:MAG TPA: hypothetical protein VNM22_02995 [Candidatus Limnocylindrales bacterium]|nr:hypothetical protein [Candidatus Limnocylindrales bacterium]
MSLSTSKIQNLLGVFFTSLAILMLELALTRIFSVTMWYHFAFMSISIAMFGLGLSGIYIYLFPHQFKPHNAEKHLVLFSLFFSLSIFVSLIVQLQIPFTPELSLEGFITVGATYLVTSIPFFLGGLTLSLALFHYRHLVSILYFSDLLGAGIGCILLIPTLNLLGGPNAVLAIAILAMVGTLFFNSALRNKERWTREDEQKSAEVGGPVSLRSMPSYPLSTVLSSSRLFTFSGLLLALLITTLLANLQNDFVRVRFSKGTTLQEEGFLYKKWNAFSLISVTREYDEGPFGWGLSEKAYEGNDPEELMMYIDEAAGTPITRFDGDLEKVNYLKYDVTALAHYLKKDADILIIGPGGGRDILTALVFRQKKITGVEVNPVIIQTVNEVFGDFTHHLYDYPGVNIVMDEGRSYIARTNELYDIIQASLIDTWAATTAGAFILTENNLYTQEAFLNYFHHLKEDGILTMSRWFFEGLPAESLRLSALGLEAWQKAGVQHPEQHMIIIKKTTWKAFGPNGVATLLMKKQPFTTEEIQTLLEVSRQLGFEVIYTPGSPQDPYFAQLTGSADRSAFYENFLLDISPPTDNKPFFFHMMRFSDFFNKNIPPEIINMNFRAVSVLGILFLVVTSLVIVFILGPLWIFSRDGISAHSYAQTPETISFLVYFSCLGLGFILVEIPLIQRFILFLGHPIYALSVILFSLLLFSGVGSYLTTFIPPTQTKKYLLKILPILGLLLVFYIFYLPHLINALLAIKTGYKILLTVLLLLPLGLLMGMPLPLGIKLVDTYASTLIPWVWGVNGATSVLASVLAMVLAITLGFSAALIGGQIAYLTAIIPIYFLSAKNDT